MLSSEITHETVGVGDKNALFMTKCTAICHVFYVFTTSVAPPLSSTLCSYFTKFDTTGEA